MSENTDKIVLDLLAKPGEPSQPQLDEIAGAIYRYDAPRYGNDVKPFAELGWADQVKFRELARIAVAKWEEMRGAA